MYNREIIGQLVDFISSKDGRTDKSRLQNEVQEAFGLVKDRSVYYCDWFAIRFCKAASRSFGNTVLALFSRHKSFSGGSNIICCFYQTVKIFFKGIVFVRIIQKLKVFRNIFNAFKLPHDVTSVETALDVISAQLL